MHACDSNARLEGKVVVVTGASSGIGYEAARRLAARGARVIMASRGGDRARRARDSIHAAGGNAVLRRLDLGSLKSVRKFVRLTRQKEPHVHALINNAGAVTLPDRITADGLHSMMQVNYFGPFLLTYLLVPLLLTSTPARVLSVTAVSMHLGNLDLPNINAVGTRSSLRLLANSKLAVSLFSLELNSRLSGRGVTSDTVDPFLVAGTDILNSTSPLIKAVGSAALRVLGRPREQVGAELAFLVGAGRGGTNYVNCWPGAGSWRSADRGLRARLWELSKRLVNISTEEDWEAS